MRVAVTGATGFLGAHVVAALRSGGHGLRILVRDPRKAVRVLGEPSGTASPTHVVGDLADPIALRELCDGVDALVHLAGLVGARSRSEYEAVNVDGCRTLYAIAREVGAPALRVVHMSSLAAAGPHASAGSEAPVSDYGRSKLAGERELAQALTGWTVLRPGAIFGPGDREFLPLFRAARRRFIPVPGAPDRRVPLAYVEDVAAVVARAVECPPIHLALDVVDPADRTLREFLTELRRALGRTPGEERVVGLPDGLVRLAARASSAVLGSRLPPTWAVDRVEDLLAGSWRTDGAGLAAALEWRDWTPLAEALTRTVAWYREHGLVRGARSASTPRSRHGTSSP